MKLFTFLLAPFVLLGAWGWKLGVHLQPSYHANDKFWRDEFDGPTG